MLSTKSPLLADQPQLVPVATSRVCKRQQRQCDTSGAGEQAGAVGRCFVPLDVAVTEGRVHVEGLEQEVYPAFESLLEDRFGLTPI